MLPRAERLWKLFLFIRRCAHSSLCEVLPPVLSLLCSAGLWSHSGFGSQGLEDVVAMEAGELQKERGLSQDAQQALESLAKRRAQLKEEIEGIQEQRKQEGQLVNHPHKHMHTHTNIYWGAILVALRHSLDILLETPNLQYYRAEPFVCCIICPRPIFNQSVEETTTTGCYLGGGASSAYISSHTCGQNQWRLASVVHQQMCRTAAVIMNNSNNNDNFYKYL